MHTYNQLHLSEIVFHASIKSLVCRLSVPGSIVFCAITARYTVVHYQTYNQLHLHTDCHQYDEA